MATVPERFPDSLGLVAASLDEPANIRRAAADAALIDIPTDPPLVAVTGVGLGMLAARATAALVAPGAPCPVLVLGAAEASGRLPADSLILDMGGGDVAGAVPVPGGPEGMGERLGLAARVVAGVRLAAAAGTTGETSAEQVADSLDARMAAHARSGTAERLVRSIGRTLPLIHAGGPVGAAIADYWKFQANLHGKVAAWTAATPALAHDEVCSWGQHGDVTRQVFTALMLRGGYESVVDAEQLALYSGLLDEFVASVHEVRAGCTGAPGDGTDPAGGPLADLCELAVLGEQVGLGLALAEGYDPAPAPGLQWRV